MTELEPQRNEVVFPTRSGLLPVPWEGGDRFVLDVPAQPPRRADQETRERVEAALGHPPAQVRQSPNATVIAVLASADEVRRAAPDLAAVARTGNGLCLTARGEGESPAVEFVSR